MRGSMWPHNHPVMSMFCSLTVREAWAQEICCMHDSIRFDGRMPVLRRTIRLNVSISHVVNNWPWLEGWLIWHMYDMCQFVMSTMPAWGQAGRGFHQSCNFLQVVIETFFTPCRRTRSQSRLSIVFARGVMLVHRSMRIYIDCVSKERPEINNPQWTL